MTKVPTALGEKNVSLEQKCESFTTNEQVERHTREIIAVKFIIIIIIIIIIAYILSTTKLPTDWLHVSPDSAPVGIQAEITIILITLPGWLP